MFFILNITKFFRIILSMGEIKMRGIGGCLKVANFATYEQNLTEEGNSI